MNENPTISKQHGLLVGQYVQKNAITENHSKDLSYAEVSKEEILTKIKRSQLSKKQIKRLRVVLLNAVEKRGSKEYKYYCRLAGFIANDEFIDQLNMTEKNSNGTVKYRARKMLETIVQSKAHNKFKNLRSLRSLGRAENARPF